MRILGADPPDPRRDVNDERWWGTTAQSSVAGVRVDAETALKISTVWACTMLLSETVAMLPLFVMRWLDRERRDREKAPDNPLYQVLHSQPNQQQTSFEFREMMMGHALLRGNGYARIVPGPRGPADQLIPLHPDRVTPEKLPNGRLRYQVTQDDGTRRPFNQEDIFHIKGMSQDGVTGLDVISFARDGFGMTLAAERYGGRFFRNDSRPGGALRTEKKLSKGAATRLKSSWEQAHTGASQHRVAVLEEGLQWQQIGVTPEQAQFLETREYQAEDVCRWFRVPPHMVGLTSKATSWGTGIEQMSIGFVTYTLMPWLSRWEQAISRDLIIATERYFAEFVVQGLLRGDIESRYNAYAIGRNWGWLSANDVRRLENMNSIGAEGDIYLQPMNMGEAGEEAGPGGNGRERDERTTDNGRRTAVRFQPVVISGHSRGQAKGHLNGHAQRAEMFARERRPGGRLAVPQELQAEHYWQLAMESAGRLIRKEVAAIGKETERIVKDREWGSKDIATIPAWREAVGDFYVKHVGLVAETLRIDETLAMDYVVEQQMMLFDEGPAVMEGWPERRVIELAEMATGRDRRLEDWGLETERLEVVP